MRRNKPKDPSSISLFGVGGSSSLAVSLCQSQSFHIRCQHMRRNVRGAQHRRRGCTTYQVTQPVRTLGLPARLRFSLAGCASDSCGDVMGVTMTGAVAEGSEDAMIDALAEDTRCVAAPNYRSHPPNRYNVGNGKWTVLNTAVTIQRGDTNALQRICAEVRGGRRKVRGRRDRARRDWELDCCFCQSSGYPR